MSRKIMLSWHNSRAYIRTDQNFYDRLWKKAKAKIYRSVSDAGYGYWDHITDHASISEFHRHRLEADDSSLGESPNLSTEALPEHSSMIDFKTFAREYPEKLFPLLLTLRPEFQELFAEYWILGKSQSFIAKCHGFIQTRTWQNLRIIEQTIGSLILLGRHPDLLILHPILEKAGLENTPYGNLSQLILTYSASQSYALVAKAVNAPVPAIRKIFRPAITQLLASKDVRTVAVGAYLRNLTHQASLTGSGLSKRCIARTKRVKNLHFTAPPTDNSALLSFGTTASLRDIPWNMLEISSDHRVPQVWAVLKTQGKRIFGKRNAAQFFAPTNADGELSFGYIFARSTAPILIRSLTRIRGISEISSTYDAEGTFVKAVTVPHTEVLPMMENHPLVPIPIVKIGDFVEILTGEASKYCGTVTSILSRSGKLIVEVNFPTGRKFVVNADKTCIRLIPNTPQEKRAFWGVRL